MLIDYILGNLLLTCINARYPGGTEAFLKDQGQIGIVPSDPPEVIIHTKGDFDPDTAFQGLNGLKFTVVHDLNFEGMEQDEVHEALNSMGQRIDEKKLGGFSLSSKSCVFVAICENEAVSREVYRELADMDGVKRARVIFPGGVHRIDDGDSSPAQTETENKGVVLESRPQRDHRIMEDEITDLKITLGTIDSVDEFLKRL